MRADPWQGLSPLEMINNLPEALCLVDREGRLIAANQRAERLLKVSWHQLGQCPLTTWLGPAQDVEKALVAAKAQGTVTHLHDALITLTDQALHADFLKIFPIPNNAGHVVIVGIVLGIHEPVVARHGLEFPQENILQMASIAKGLAHEIKNPLSGIRGAAQLIARDYKMEQNLQEMAQMIETETLRVAELVDRLAELSKPPQLKRRAENIHRLLRETIVLMQPLAAQGVEWHEEFDPSVPAIWADGDRLKQVLINVLKNAIEAVGADGTITVVTGMARGLSVQTRDRRRRMAQVVVRDNGVGIDPEDLRRIRSPFFTTKNSGSGLGLAICDQLLHAHDGMLEIESVSGHGTKVTILVPLVEA